jgi:hypothetical protein
MDELSAKYQSHRTDTQGHDESGNRKDRAETMNLEQTDCRQRENSNHQSYNENSARKAVGETEQQIDPKAENHGRKTESGSEGTRVGVLCREGKQ